MHISLTGETMPKGKNTSTRAFRVRSSGLLVAWLCLLPGQAAGQAAGQSPPTLPASPQGDLTTVSLEDLMNIEVTSVSKKGQKLSRTAAAVFVITQEDIQRSGATNIPDLLRMVPGMDVAQINASTWAISARGLNSEFSNELLVMMDGRNVYTPTFGGVFWEALDLPLENIERIEVIRGPGGSIWGENAVNGVVNIIQKKASETSGAMVVAGGGNSEQGFGTTQYGGHAGKNMDYRIYSKYFNESELKDGSGEPGGDGYHVLRGGFRADAEFSAKDSLTVQGSMYTGREGDPTTVLLSITAPGPENNERFVNIAGGFVQSIWNHTYSERSESSLMFSYDQYERSDLLGDKRRTFNVDFHHHYALGARQELVWGLAYRETAENSSGTFGVSLVPPSQSTDVFSAFVQDEIAAIPDRLYFTLGTKLEHNTYTGFAPLPSARALYEFNDRQMMWVGVSRAVRVPAETDVSLRLNVANFTEPDGTPGLISIFGNPHVKDENVIAYEVGYRTEIGQHLSIDLAAYYNDYDNQISSEPATPFFEATPLPAHLVIPSLEENLIEGEAHGAEIAANWKVTRWWTLSPSYDFERIHMHDSPLSQDVTSAPQTNGSDPHQHARIRSHVDLPHRIGWDAAAYFTDRLVAQGVPSYTRVDTNVSWRCGKHLTFAMAGQNLWKAQRLEFIESTGATNSTVVPRSWYAKLTWRF
jgi:iron complex outermembrane receptor protein